MFFNSHQDNRIFIIALAVMATGQVQLLAQDKVKEEDFIYSLNARQMFYLDRVPHTDKQGKIRYEFDSEKSFLPIILYHPRTHLDAEKTMPTPFDKIKNAGFNTVETTEKISQELLAELTNNDLKLIKVPTTADEAKKFADSSAIFAWEIIDEPEADGEFHSYQNRFSYFEEVKNQIRLFDLKRPIYVNTTAWIGQPNQVWWAKWHQVGDISCHDNYPYDSAYGYSVNNRPQSLSFFHGIPESVGLAISCTGQNKPIWLIVQAFEDRRWFFPTGVELRAMVYAGIVHGAVGINYFSFDNHMTRDAQMLGISPNPVADYNRGRTASKYEQEQIKYLWGCSAAINSEINDSKPWILSPTSKEFYKVNIRGKKITDTPIRTLLKNYNNQYRLFVVNLDRTPFDIKIEFSRSVKTIERLYEKGHKTPLIKETAFEDSLVAMGVGVYQIELSE